MPNVPKTPKELPVSLITDHYAGEHAFIDSFGGLIPCVVLSVIKETQEGVTSGVVEVKVKKTMGGYREGEICVKENALYVVPVTNVKLRGHSFRIVDRYNWRKGEKPKA